MSLNCSYECEIITKVRACQTDGIEGNLRTLKKRAVLIDDPQVNLVVCSYLQYIWILIGSYMERGRGERNADTRTEKKLPILEQACAHTNKTEAPNQKKQVYISRF